MNIEIPKLLNKQIGEGQKPTNSILLMLMVGVLLTACSNEDSSDAYGQFEATETTISSETQGKLLHFVVDEGYELNAGQQVGLVDTTRLVLQRDELSARLQSIEARVTNINAQVEVQKSELETAQADLNRIQSLIKDRAATQKQLDDVQARVRTIRKQVDALETQKQPIRAEINATQAQIAQMEDQIEDALIINPIEGTVLTTFVEPHEVVQMGQPLYRIAGLDTLTLRVYVSGSKLPAVKLGQDVEVLVDKNEKENQSLAGKVSWIANQAEFTPQQIQTKEERVTQVYAMKVRVPNQDGILKIGMPGEVNFKSN